MTTGKLIKELRNSKNLTQAEFAKIFKISNGTIAMWETDKRQPDSDTLKKLADYFGVSVDYLLGREEKKTVTNPDENKIEIMARGGFTCSYTFSDDEMETARRILETIKKSQGIPTKDKKDK